MAAQYISSLQQTSKGATVEYAVADGATVNVGDFVYLAAGRVTAASIAGKRLLGVVEGVQNENLDRVFATSATGNAGGTVKVLVCVEEDARWLVDGDNVGTTLAVTHEGTYFDLTGNPGAQLVDTSTTSATSGQLLLRKFNPGIRGTDASWGIYTIAEKQSDVDDIGAS